MRQCRWPPRQGLGKPQAMTLQNGEDALGWSWASTLPFLPLTQQGADIGAENSVIHVSFLDEGSREHAARDSRAAQRVQLAPSFDSLSRARPAPLPPRYARCVSHSLRLQSLLYTSQGRHPNTGRRIKTLQCPHAQRPHEPGSWGRSSDCRATNQPAAS